MRYISTSDVTPVLEHDDTVSSFFMVPMETMREATQGSHLQFINEFTVQPGRAIEPHFHNSHEYYYVLSGVYRRLDWMDESRKALEVFKRLDRESNELDKKRRAAIAAAGPSSPDRK